MPWIKDERGEETFVPPPRPAEMFATPLPRGVGPRDPAGLAQRERERMATMLWLNRLVIEWTGLYNACPRKACQRAGACRGKTVPCHEEALPLLREKFYPRLHAVLNGKIPRYDPDDWRPRGARRRPAGGRARASPAASPARASRERPTVTAAVDGPNGRGKGTQ